jgi:hypothetical protein
MKLILSPARIDGLRGREEPPRYYAILKSDEGIGPWRPVAWRFDADTPEEADTAALAFVVRLRDACAALLRTKETP